ncbi:hypothetical protein L2E82_15465 [Cichorium intybus]|uniref:Uncharacterized protein n=1 Tax=Cichorium intybus TaxID=13427 RepID=A0ACB9F461_CICIN|nr:hypothetical protein L2E82_15465 [Cichorium intybus]
MVSGNHDTRIIGNLRIPKELGMRLHQQREGFLRAKTWKSLKLEARNWNHSLELVIPKLNKLENRSSWPAAQRSRPDTHGCRDPKSRVFATRHAWSSRPEEQGLRDPTIGLVWDKMVVVHAKARNNRDLNTASIQVETASRDENDKYEDICKRQYQISRESEIDKNGAISRESIIDKNGAVSQTYIDKTG